jgi:hypothetical protein
MAMIKLPIVGAAYALKDTSVDAQTCINLYPQVVESGNAARVSALMPTPALTLFSALSGACRGLFELGSGDVLCVSGTSLYRLPASGGAAVLLGAIAGTSQVSMAENGQQAVIVNGTQGYALNLTTWALTQIISEAFYGADFVAFLAGRFVFNKPNTGQFYWSGIYNTEFDGLAFATAEASPDRITAVVQGQDQLWLFGSQSAEVHYATGDQDLPFTRLQGAFIQAGCTAPRSICRIGTAMIWLGVTEAGNAQVVMTESYTPKRISTHAIEAAISRYAVIDDAVAYVYQQEGHGFYVLTFPAANVTWVFDTNTGLWHQRAGFVFGQLTRHRSQHHCMYRGRHLVGDYQNSKLYTLDLDGVTDDGQTILRERTCPTLGTDGQQVRFNKIELVCQVGAVVGTLEPKVMLQWSKDQGKTWTDPQIQTLGKQGEYTKRVIWHRLGVSRDRVFRIRFTDAARLVISDCRLDAGQ